LIFMLIWAVRRVSSNLAKYFKNPRRPRNCPMVDHGVGPERCPAKAKLPSENHRVPVVLWGII